MPKPSEFNLAIKKSKGDEYYTHDYAVEVLVPLLKQRGYKKIWCPFDLETSAYVRVLKNHGFEVVHGHIETGQDFFEQDLPPGVDIVCSNPPFSKREQIYGRLFEWQVPFALLSNSNGLFDSKGRYEMFSTNPFGIIVPRGRMNFINGYGEDINSVSFQTVYVTSRLIDEQIKFIDFIPPKPKKKRHLVEHP